MPGDEAPQRVHNRINPRKLPLSKWTRRSPVSREKHFIVTQLIRNEDERIIGCEIEAVMTKRCFHIDWRELEDGTRWIFGWK